MYFAIGLVSLVLAFPAWAGNRCESYTTLFFVNGMFNDRRDASASLNAILEKLKATPSWDRRAAYLSYNVDEPLLVQLVEVFEQKWSSFDRRFWEWTADSSVAPSWFQDLVRAGLAKRELTGLHADTLKEHLANYESELSVGRSLALVAHSQGNFFANSAAKVLERRSLATPVTLQLVSVASPDFYVYGGGTYFNLASDWIIRLIPGALVANKSNTTPKPGLFDHRFRDHYLNGNPTGPSLVASVQGVLQKLDRNNLAVRDTKKIGRDCSDLFRWLDEQLKPGATKSQCMMACATAPVDMSDFHCPNSHCEEYCGCNDLLPLLQ